MKIDKNKDYTVGEAIIAAMENLEISFIEASQMIWEGINSGELRLQTAQKQRKSKKNKTKTPL